MKKYKHDKVVLEELNLVIDLLINEKSLPEKYRNHRLTGNYSGMMELHLRPDDLLVYFKIEKESITLVAIGSHADLFG
ncbi:MAG: type II toxin-antitoxin system YafQ family toxin [Proteobacteria bacterium]|nr:type II toxin-antitoxin system YafQ family toxin [Pseudomonadota bacterium]